MRKQEACTLREKTKAYLIHSQIHLLLAVLLSFLILASLYSPLTAQSLKGKISGKILDAETGEALIGANVVLKGTQMGAATDLEGSFYVPAVPPGNYEVVVTMIGYTQVTVTDVIVNAGEVTTINTTLQSEVLETEGVVVTAKAIRNTEAVLLKDRQKATSLSDAISIEAISRAGSGDAAEAMKQITGASVVDGKHVFVRGLGDRYTSTQLNGAELPSADPYTRSGTIDIIPSNLIDNIVTEKSFTPDKPGNFSGGTVNINTKDFPEDLRISFSAATSFNTQTTFKDGLGITNGGNMIWLGTDNGNLDIPNAVSDTLAEDISYLKGEKKPGIAVNDSVTDYINNFTKSFNHSMAPTSKKSPLNQKYSLSIGNQTRLFNRPLGFIASLTYKRNFRSYTDGTYARWELKADQAAASGLENWYDFKEQKTIDEVLWGANIKTSYSLSPLNKISFSGLYNRNGEATGRRLQGFFNYDIQDDQVYDALSQHYKERSLASMQFDGDHQLKGFGGLKVNWQTSYTESNQAEPDIRYFVASITDTLQNGSYQYRIPSNLEQERYYRDLTEDRFESKVDLELPIQSLIGRKGKIKMGWFYAQKNRDFIERRFVYQPNNEIQKNLNASQGNINDAFNDEYLGLIGYRYPVAADSSIKYYDLGIALLETDQRSKNYTGRQDINAAYLMTDLFLTHKLRLITGLRYEKTDMAVENETKDFKSEIKTDDFLPSFNLLYNFFEDMNIRLAYGKTLSRPNFREISPLVSYDFKEGDKFFGNDTLKRTLIHNADIRWEWFPEPGEIIAVSAFYKRFRNPVEMVILKTNNYRITWENVDEAISYGMEFEIRQGLDIINESLRNFSLGSNFSIIKSEVSIDSSDSRPFQGQSPYLINVSASYDNLKRGIAANLYYNIFGERLAAIGKGDAPNIYEQPAATLNFSLSKKLTPQIALNFAVNNILNDTNKEVQEFKGKEFVSRYHRSGRTFSLGFNYTL